VQGARVLIADDDAAIRDVVQAFLVDEGYVPILARDGAEAIAHLNSEATFPDIMLLDLLMPNVDGYQVLNYLRQNLLEKFPVLVFSAQRPDATILEALDSEWRDFVAKPFNLSELLIRMQRLLRRSPRLAAVESRMLRVYALGSLRVYRDEHLLMDESWRNKSAKTLFKLLFTGAGRRYPKDVLTEDLWPEVDPEVGANRLRVAIHELRKALGGGARSDPREDHIGQQEGSYFFDTTVPHWSDVKAFEDYVSQGDTSAADGRPVDALHAYTSAEALYQGEYLRDDPFSEWSVATRERLRERHLTMLAHVAQIDADLGRPDDAAAFCRKILRIEPWREEVYRRLMEYLAAAGRSHEALRAYEECRRTLQAEIEASPSPQTTALRDRILAGLQQHSDDPVAGTPIHPAER
jgi:two-component SAPR family response regulator